MTTLITDRRWTVQRTIPVQEEEPEYIKRSQQAYPSALYTPLQPNEIRLLTILPTDKLECHLRTVSFADEPAYECLSYCWGDPNITDTVLIEGHPIAITTNLAAALRRLRGVRDLWVDALCIWQSNNEEKGTQVAMMPDIFRKAINVRAWLACPYGDDGSRAEACRKGLDILSEFGPIWYADCVEPLRETVLLFENVYWTRIWVLQEQVLAKSVTIYFGSLEYPLRQSYRYMAQRCEGPQDQAPSRLEYLWSRFDRTLARKDELLEIASARCKLFNVLYRYPEETETIPSLLHMVNFQCTLKHDRVYGLLSLMGVDIKPDYNLTYAYVFSAFSRVLMGDSYSWLATAISYNQDLPSWVIDLTAPNLRTTEFYEASKGSKYASTPVRHWSTLCVPGYLIGRVGIAIQLTHQADMLSLAAQNSQDSLLRSMFMGADPFATTQSRFTRSSLEKCRQIIQAGTREMPGIVTEGTVFITDRGIVGVANAHIQIGDKLCIIATCRLPFCVRAGERDGVTGHILISECYADGISFGEAMTGNVDDLFCDVDLI